MTKAELIERIARSRELPPNVTKRDIALVLGVAFEELATYFARTKVTRASSPRFTFPHFGTFTKKRRSARRGVNPRTLEPMKIEAFDTVDFKASRELRESMNPVAAAPAKSSSRKASTPAGGREKTRDKAASAASTSSVTGRRTLTPRDEEAELDAIIGDDTRFEGAQAKPSSRRARADLPAARLQRVDAPRSEDADAKSGRRSSRARR